MSIREIKDSLVNQTLTKLIKRKKPNKLLQDEIDKRIDICLGCPSLKSLEMKKINISLTYCGKCKCSFPSFVFAYEKKCPDNRWDSIPDDIIG